MTRIITVALTMFLSLVCLAPASAGSFGSIGAGDQTVTRPKSDGLYHQARQCWERIGPFATQDTAWRRWRQARSQGYAVSNGVTPCWQDGTRGYCFRVYYSC